MTSRVPVSIALLVLGVITSQRPAGAEVITAAGGVQVFKNEWCFCIMPSIRPDHPASLSNVAYGVAALPDGRLAVAGCEPRDRPNLGSGWVVRVQDTAGAVAWSRTFIWVNAFYQVAKGVAVDPKGRVVAAGFSEFARGSPVPAHWLVACYGPDGTRLWHDALASTAPIRAEAVATDADGSVVVAGWESQPSAVDTRWLVRRYAAGGKLEWTRTFAPGPGQNMARAVAIGRDGAAYVAGGVSEGAGRGSWAVRVWERDGNLRWARTYASAGGWMDEAYAVALDGAGRIAVAGKVFGGADRRVDWGVRVLDSGGDVRWEKFHNGPLAFDDKAYAAGFDRCGRVVVAGYEDGDTAQKSPWDAGRWMIRTYDAAGTVLRELHDQALGTRPGGPYGLAFLKDGRVAVAGFEQTPEVGKTAWSVRLLDAPPCPGKPKAP
ncbi:MAG: hypothetical protein AAB152_14520 [Candidatus Coatesbacteria bacterium]